MPYTAFKEQVAKGNVESIYSQGASIEGRFKAAGHLAAAGRERAAAASAPRGLPRPRAAHREAPFTTTLPAFVDPGLEAFLIEHDVEISAVPIQTGSALVDAAVRLRPGDPDHRVLRLAVPARAQQGGGMGGG